MKLIGLLLLVSFWQPTRVDKDPTNKKFKGLESASCRELTNGGCMVYTYRILDFRADSVVISYEVIPNCTPSELDKNYANLYKDLTSTYAWSLHNDTVTIEGFENYGRLFLYQSTLYGTNQATQKSIEFHVEH